MKKLATILFLIPIFAIGQVQPTEDWSFKTDKKLHSLVGGATSAGSFLFVLSKGGNAEDALVASFVIPSLLALGKEVIDTYNGSLADISYTIGSAIIVGGTMYIIKRRKNKKRAKKIKQRFDIDDNNFALNNPIFVNNK